MCILDVPAYYVKGYYHSVFLQHFAKLFHLEITTYLYSWTTFIIQNMEDIDNTINRRTISWIASWFFYDSKCVLKDFWLLFSVDYNVNINIKFVWKLSIGPVQPTDAAHIFEISIGSAWSEKGNWKRVMSWALPKKSCSLPLTCISYGKKVQFFSSGVNLRGLCQKFFLWTSKFHLLFPINSKTEN